MENSAALRIRLLGTAQLTFADAPVTDGAGKPLPAKLLMLLCYLAIRKQAASRGEIMDLLWPGMDPANVRNALKRLRSCTGARHWLSEAAAISVRASTDLDSFNQAVESGRFLEALSIWGTSADPGHHVLAGGGIDYQDDVRFADWLAEVQAQASASYQSALYGAVLELEARGNYAEALGHARELLAADPLQEEPNYRTMQLQYLLGEYRYVLSHFDNLRRTLEAEGLPSAAPRLLALKEQAELALAARNSRRLEHQKSLETQLRQFGSTFVGRERELSQLAPLIRQPGSQVTIHGAGGAGKSRLAAELGQRATDWFDDGVAFIALDGARALQDLVLAILRGLGVNPMQAGVSTGHLLDYLSGQNLLLVLDNLTAGPETRQLLEAIAQARNVSCVATSRTNIGTPGEQLFLLHGLEHHKSAGSPLPKSAPEAAELFVQCARRFDLDFRVSADDEAALVTICSFVAGMPLYIEHLATWTRVMSVQEIATELTTGTELLSAVVSELPERHQQLGLVLDHSWAMLPEAARLPTAKLAMFQGGFTTQAARQVANAGLLELRAAVNAAFVKRASGDWFELHDVMREYLAGILRTKPGAYADTQERHFDYYRQFAQELSEGLARGENDAWLLRFTHDRLNLDLAADWARTARPEPWVSFVSNIGTALVDYSYHNEALAHFEQVLVSEPEDSRAVVEILTKGVYVHMARLELDKATSQLAQAEALVQRLQDDEAELLYLFASAALALQNREAGEAKRLLHTALELTSRVTNKPAVELKILSNLGLAYNYSGDKETAVHWYQRALTMSRSSGHVQTEGIVAGNLAIIHHLRGQYDRAFELYSASVRTKRESGDRLGLLLSLGNLGTLFHTQGKNQAAREAWEEAFALAEAAGNANQKARMLANLGRTAHVQGDDSRARVLFEQALAQHRQTRNQVGITNTLLNLALTEDALSRKRSLLDESLQLARQLQLSQGFNIVGILLVTAEVSEAEGNLPAAVAQLTEAAELVLAGDDPAQLARLASNVGCLASGMGDFDTAIALLNAADDLYSELAIVREPANQLRVDARRQLAEASLEVRPGDATAELPLAELLRNYLQRSRHQPEPETGYESVMRN